MAHHSLVASFGSVLFPLTNDAGTACASAGGSSLSGANSGLYWWSSTTAEPDAVNAWAVNFFTGIVFDYTFGKSDAALRGWAVRNGR